MANLNVTILLVAMALYASKLGEGEAKKPTVDQLKDALKGVDGGDKVEVNAEIRDKAWDSFLASLEAGDDGEETGVPVVTNNTRGPLKINGVEIAAGASASVEGFDPEHKVLSRWLDAGVIEVE